MDKYLSMIIPVIMSIGSALLTALYFTGRNLEKIRIMEEKQKEHDIKIQELIERASKLEGINEAK